MALSRRSFLKSSAAAGAFTMTGGAAKAVLAEKTSATFAPSPVNKWPGKVVVNFNKDAVSNNTTIGDPQVKVIKKMVDDSILALAGKTDLGEAWKEIFPTSLSTTSKIAIKTNFYTTTMCRVHWSVIQGITEGLQKMNFNGTAFPAGNITVFEAFAPNSLTSAGYTSDRFPGINLVFETDNTVVKNVSDAAKGETNGYVPSLKNADFLINTSGIRGHMAYTEGYTILYKSHWGTYSRTSPAHTDKGDAFSIRAANLMCSGAIYNKQVLCVAGGLISNKKGSGINDGPVDYSIYAKKMDPNCTTKASSTIILGTDPVSVEMQAIKVMQINENKTYAVADMPKYLRASAGDSAALSGTVYNIGKIKEEEMSIKTIINGASNTPILEQNKIKAAETGYSLHISPLKQGIVFVEYMVPSQVIGGSAKLSIYDVKGNLVFSKDEAVHGVLNHYSWDGKIASGKMLGHGKYVCKLAIGSASKSATFSMV
jgi:hypothetical protein